MDCFKIISEVKKRRALWDSTVKMSDRKTIFTSDWIAAAKEINMDVETTRKRWKGLRDHYRSEIRRMQQGQISASTWKYFQAMEFLRPIFDPDKLVCLEAQQSELDFEVTISHESDGNKISVDLNEPITLENDDSFGFDVIDEEIFNLTNNNNTSRNCSPPPPAKRFRYTEHSDVAIQNTSNNNIQKQNKESVQYITFQKDNEKTDSDYNFLVSMLPHMKSLSDMGNLKFRMEVSKLLIDLKQSEMDDQPHAKSSKFAQTPQEIRSNTSQLPTPNALSQFIDVRYLKADNFKYNGQPDSDLPELEIKSENESEVN